MCDCDRSIIVALPVGNLTGDVRSVDLSDLDPDLGGPEAVQVLAALRSSRPVYLHGLTCEPGGGGTYRVSDEHGTVASRVRLIPAGEHPPPLRVRVRSGRLTLTRLTAIGFGDGVTMHLELSPCAERPCP